MALVPHRRAGRAVDGSRQAFLREDAVQTWRIYTESGSLYEVHEVTPGEYILTADHTPTARSADLRGMRLAMAEPMPWPPVLGLPLLLVIKLSDRIEVRRTSAVLRLEQPSLTWRLLRLWEVQAAYAGWDPRVGELVVLLRLQGWCLLEHAPLELQPSQIAQAAADGGFEMLAIKTTGLILKGDTHVGRPMGHATRGDLHVLMQSRMPAVRHLAIRLAGRT